MASSQEIAVQSNLDSASLDRLDTILRTGEIDGPEIVDDPSSISRSIIAQLLDARSDAELQDFGNAEGWREYLEVPMELHGFRWQKSDYDEGSPIYFIVQATELQTGTRRVLTTGSLNVLAQLSNMARRGTLEGGIWMLHEAEEKTRSGFKPLWLVQPESVRKASASGKEPASK